MAAADMTDPYRAYNFILDLNGVTVGRFTEVTGLEVQVEVIAYREGGADPAVRQLPGRVRYEPVELRYGLSDSRELWDWLMSTARGQVERRNLSVILLSSDRSAEVTRWNLTGAWPCNVRCAELKALGNEVAYETISLVYEGIERA